MEYIGPIIFACVQLAILLGIGWCAHCNNKTYKQRKNLRAYVMCDDSHNNIMSALFLTSKVKYNDHYKKLLFMQNPWVLYKMPVDFVDD